MQEVKKHTVLDQHIIRTLMYYDIFNYPLKASEVFRFLGMNSISETDVLTALNDLADRMHISRFGEFYSIQPKEENVTRRVKGNELAKKLLPLALEKAQLIAKFPFIRAVMASGSLSKNYMDEASDLDFFIVTAPKRLWICRTLLVLYKRLFLGNSHKFFCVNYFVDTDHLEIEEKNLFTATELATVMPLYGAEYYTKLLEQNNQWLLKFFPNFQPRDTARIPQSRQGTLKKLTEACFNFFFGEFLEKIFMKLTLMRWKKLYQQNYNADDFTVAFKTKKYASKNHPRHFQKKVMEVYTQKTEDFENKIK